MKAIAFEGADKNGNVILGHALQAGYQIDVFGGVQGTGISGSSTKTLASEAGLAAVPVNADIAGEIKAIHAACVKFLGN